MNNYLASERGKKADEIEMPGLTEEQVAQATEPEIEVAEVTEPETVESTTDVQVAPVESDRDRNFRALREKADRADRAERERDEALRYIESLRQTKQPEPEEAEYSLAPDEFAEGKHLSQVDKKIKRLENQLKQYQQQSSTNHVENRLKGEYPDFDKIVSVENVNALRDAYPEIAETLNSSNDLYSKAKSAYTLIKKLGIYQDPNAFQQDVQRVKTNAAKPRPLTSVSPQQAESPLARVNAFEQGLTKELQSQLHKEMIEAMKGR